LKWSGKFFFGFFGFLIGGPIGFIFGLIFGHQFDKNTQDKRFNSFRVNKISYIFFKRTFNLMGYIAKSDGHISEKEINVARRLMHNMSLSPNQVKEAIKFYTQGKDLNFFWEEAVDSLYEDLKGHPDLIKAFIETQMQAAFLSEDLDPKKRNLIWRVAEILRISRDEFSQMEALIYSHNFSGKRPANSKKDLETAYKVLGVNMSTDNQDIKIAYRRLMNQHHPDKLVARGLPKSMVREAEKKTQEIRLAYEKIKKNRMFK
tara:strand:- start:162 stop:941 length:780 start_codon:yes stop_codon:yes gene_type:complete